MDKDVSSSQFEYLGRWVSKKDFRAFVYNGKEQRLAASYQEFIDLIGSGLWYETLNLAENHLNKEANKLNKHLSKVKVSSAGE